MATAEPVKHEGPADYGTKEGGLIQKHKGAHSEHLAVVWLLSNGYEVFRNVSSHGAIDLAAIKNGMPRYIDVKSVHANIVDKTGTVSCSVAQARSDGVELLFVCPCGFITFSQQEAFERVTGRRWLHRGPGRRARIRDPEEKFAGGAEL